VRRCRLCERPLTEEQALYCGICLDDEGADERELRAIIDRLTRERDEARQNAEVQGGWHPMFVEAITRAERAEAGRDEARAEVERLRETVGVYLSALDATRATMTSARARHAELVALSEAETALRSALAAGEQRGCNDHKAEPSPECVHCGDVADTAREWARRGRTRR
jgi:hypothetical protein